MLTRHAYLFFLCYALYADINAATYTVTSTAEGTTVDGVSLRWAITQANTNPGADIIDFNLGAAGPYTIALTTALPNLTDNSGVTINGWENGTNDGTPNSVAVFSATTSTPMNAVYKVILGNSASVATGLVLASNNNVIQGLVLQNFGDGTVSANDIAITISGNSNQILGCYIGVGSDGATRGTKTNIGVYITGNSNIIGDGTAAGANLISGTNTSGIGIQIKNAAATGNVIKGNMIGLQKDGTSIVTGASQDKGVEINSAGNNTIGGTGAGDGNVISGNTQKGVHIIKAFSDATGNLVYQNIIGLRADGITIVTSNSQFNGVDIFQASSNTVGGNSSSHRNIISGNLTCGIALNQSSCSLNVIIGNYIGLQSNGTTIVTSGSQDYGVQISNSATNNTIGGTAAGEGNLISGNTVAGIYTTSNAGNNIYQNIIGLRQDGATVVTSNPQTTGIYLNASPSNVIGGNSSGHRNIISGNGTNGIYITGAGSTSNLIKGNYIGLRSNGTTIVTSGSQDYGVYFTSSATSNNVGGTGAGEGNVISGNTNSGIYTNSSSGNSIYQNIIGLQQDGATVVASNPQGTGVYLSASPSNVIGGNSSSHRNIISGNATYGIFITSASATSNDIKGNYIGLRANGTTIVTSGSQDYGVYIESGATGNTIGGSAAGEGNVLSGNINSGIVITQSSSNTIIGNIIGLQQDGNAVVASNPQGTGIQVAGTSSSNIIGGNSSGHRNIISGNTNYGIFSASAITSNTIKGNYIGLQSNGTTFVASSSQDYGIYMSSATATGNIIGGTGAGEGNVISGNVASVSLSSAGIVLQGHTNTITGNIIGLQADGNTFLAGAGYTGNNTQDVGIAIYGYNNTVGGNTSGHRNIISGNNTHGIYLTGVACSTNVVMGSYIGTQSDGSTAVASSSQDYGIYLTTSAANNTIGGTAAGEANIIVHNTVNGVYLTGAGTTGNKISGNSIYSNSGIPIVLASSANNSKAVPIITTSDATSVTGVSVSSDVIEVYTNTTGSNIDARLYMGTTTADGSGNWSLTAAFNPGDYILATARDASNNTSEFSGSQPLPVELTSFDGHCNEHEVLLNWTTSSEKNNNYFSIQRSQDGVVWDEIGQKKGSGYTNEHKWYEFIDQAPLNKAYYRLKQIDYDGKFEVHPTKFVVCHPKEDLQPLVYPNPTSGLVSLQNLSKGQKISLINQLGQVIYQDFVNTSQTELDLSYLTKGVYFISITDEARSFQEKIVLR